jgi:mono/diheme cytochrome c family protein
VTSAPRRQRGVGPGVRGDDHAVLPAESFLPVPRPVPRLRAALVVSSLYAALVHVSAGQAQTVAGSPLTAVARGKAETMLRDRLPCLGCHALGPSGGGRLAPDLATVGARRDAAYIAAMVDDPQRVVPGTMMPRTPMPAATRALIVGYLSERASPTARMRSPAPGASPPSPASLASLADTSGARLYARLCAGCHGARGAGDGPNAPHLPVPPAVHASRAAMAVRSDDRLFDAITAGGESLGRSARMPGFGATLAPAQIHALVRHIRSLCACEGPEWSTDGAAARGARP